MFPLCNSCVWCELKLRKSSTYYGQTFLKSDLTAINSKIRDKSNQIQEFCNETGYKRDRFREQVNNKTSVGHTTGNTQKYKDTLKNDLTSALNSGNMDSTEMFRAKDTSRKDYKIISEDTFNKLTIQVRKNGGIILRGTDEIEKHLNDMGANAANIGDVLLFRKEVCLSEVF